MKTLFTKEMVKKTMDDFLEKTDEEIIATLYYIGEEFVNVCKLSGSYTDRTGNLRSSIGCAVMKDGEIIKMVSYGENPEGVKTGEEFMKEELKSMFPTGYYLVVYAGMHYAIYVETKGFSVISSFLPSQWGKEDFAKLISDLI